MLKVLWETETDEDFIADDPKSFDASVAATEGSV